MTIERRRKPLSTEIFERTIQRLTRWCTTSSASADFAGLATMGRQLVDDATELALVGTLRESSDDAGRILPVVELRTRDDVAADERSPLLLLGHFDTVLPAAPARREPTRLVATGAIDMKGGIAAFFGALELLDERGVTPPDLLLILTPDEEVGGAISAREVEHHGSRARALWVLEPGSASVDGETIVTGRRGLRQWRVDVRGRAAHSGVDFWSGRSAVAAAADWCRAAAALSGRSGGPTVNIARIAGGGARFVENLAAEAALLGTSREINVVADRAIADGELRFLHAEEGAQLEATLHELSRDFARRHEVEIDFQVTQRIAPLDPERSGTLWSEHAFRSAAAASSGGWSLSAESARGGISFPNFLPATSRIPVLDGLGPVGGGMHTRDEFVDFESLRRRIELLADLLALEAESVATPT